MINEPPVSSSLFVGIVVALSSSLVVVLTLLVISAIMVCVFVRMKNSKGSSGPEFEMVGHVGRASRDSLDFQSHVGEFLNN